MTTALFAVLVLLMSGAMAAAFEPPGEGPWRGTIVDADTKQPLEGVVVLAVWNERYGRDRKSTRLNSSHGYISYAVFCLKKKKEASPSHPLHLCRKSITRAGPQ